MTYAADLTDSWPVRTDVTPDEVEFFRANGFVVVEDFLDSNDLIAWRECITRAVGDRALPSSRSGPERLLEPRGAQDRDAFEYYQRVFVQRINLWQTHDDVRELVVNPIIGGMAATLAGVDGIRLFQDQALFKPAWGNATAFHLDVPYWSFTSTASLSLWVALDDATQQNGCLYFIPGSHRLQRFAAVGIGRDIGALFERCPEWRDTEPVACPIPAGAASFHAGLTAHGAGANMTPRTRRAMTMQFMPEGSTFNGTPNVLPRELLDRLTIGDPLDDEDVHPLLWSRAMDARRG